MVPNSKEQGLLGDGPDLHEGIGLAAIDGMLRPSQSWLDGDFTGAAACIGTRAVSNKYVCSIIAAIEILECSRLGFYHGDQVAEGLMESLVEIKDSKGVRRNVGVISGQVEVFWVEPGPQLVGIGRIEWLGERGLDGAIGHTQEFDQTCVPRVALERDQPLICRPLNMANVPGCVTIEGL
jgi:hypothetical protein